MAGICRAVAPRSLIKNTLLTSKSLKLTAWVSLFPSHKHSNTHTHRTEKHPVKSHGQKEEESGEAFNRLKHQAQFKVRDRINTSRSDLYLIQADELFCRP